MNSNNDCYIKDVYGFWDAINNGNYIDSDCGTSRSKLLQKIYVYYMVINH